MINIVDSVSFFKVHNVNSTSIWIWSGLQRCLRWDWHKNMPGENYLVQMYKSKHLIRIGQSEHFWIFGSTACVSSGVTTKSELARLKVGPDLGLLCEACFQIPSSLDDFEFLRMADHWCFRVFYKNSSKIIYLIKRPKSAYFKFKKKNFPDHPKLTFFKI